MKLQTDLTGTPFAKLCCLRVIPQPCSSTLTDVTEMIPQNDGHSLLPLLSPVCHLYVFVSAVDSITDVYTVNQLKQKAWETPAPFFGITYSFISKLDLDSSVSKVIKTRWSVRGADALVTSRCTHQSLDPSVVFSASAPGVDSR